MSRAFIPDLRDEAHAAGLDEPELLFFRANLPGSDLRVANCGGGNTSAKVAAADRRAASIDAPLHASAPQAHIDHMHREAVIAIAAAGNAVSFTR